MKNQKIKEQFMNDLKELLNLGQETIEGYEAAIERLKNEKYKIILEKFKNDHKRHIKKISDFCIKNKIEIPAEQRLSAIITQGKIIFAKIAGDIAILKAMRSNEIRTNEAYYDISMHDGIPENMKKILLDGYEDEKRHLSWLEEELFTEHKFDHFFHVG